MQTTRRSAPLWAAALLSSALALGTAHAAQTPAKDYAPSVGQEGRDVIWVPTPSELVDRMLTMAETKPTDYVIDLGSGDGRTVIAAAKKFGATALGVEYNPDMVALSRRSAEKEGVAGKAQFQQGDIFQTDFSKATVLTLYLLPSLNLKLRPTILNMKPGTRVVSHAFSMEDWQADQTESVEGRTAYMWIVPAKVAGVWRLDVAGASPRTYETTFQQQYQNVSGSVRSNGKPLQFGPGKLRGETLTFSITDESNVRRDFTGRAVGDKIEGMVKVAGTSAESKWSATRTSAR